MVPSAGCCILIFEKDNSESGVVTALGVSMTTLPSAFSSEQPSMLGFAQRLSSAEQVIYLLGYFIS